MQGATAGGGVVEEERSAPRADAGPERSGRTARALAALRGPRGAAWVFGLLAVGTVPLIVFHLGAHYWFLRDDWMFITERRMTAHDLFEPHAGHWSTGLVLFFRVFWKVFGARTFVPWQAAVVIAHVGVVALGRQVMRRAGVGPWIATTVAAAGLLYGSGREDILWAFQFGFTGSLMLGLLQLVLADHDGPIGRRDAVAVVAGLLGMATASPMLMVFPVTVVAVLVKRGWRPAAVQAAPLGLIYLAWSAVEHPKRQPFGPAPRDVLLTWIRHGLVENFRALGVYEPVAIALALVLVVGVAVALVRPPAASRYQGDRFRPGPSATGAAALDRVRRVVAVGRAHLAPVAAPVGLLVALLVFTYSSGQARWWQGERGSGASRYLYAYAAFTLPALGVAAQALAERARLAGAVVVALVLVAVPANVRRFDDPPFGPRYFDRSEAILRNAVRMPFARQVPGDVRPDPDAFMGEHVTMRFLLESVAAGRLEPATGPIAPAIRNELTVRLSLLQEPPDGFPTDCDWVDRPETLTLRKGERLFLSGPVVLHLVTAGKPAPLGIPLRPGDGAEVTVTRGPLRVLVESGEPGQPLHLCRAG